MRAKADARTVSSVTHRVPAAAEGRYRLTFSAVGGFGAVFGGRRTNANGGFNEVGVSQVPLRPSSIHPSRDSPPRSATHRRRAGQRICRTKTHISIEGVK